MGKRFACLIVILALTVMSATTWAVYRSYYHIATHSGRLFNFNTWDAEIIWHATFFSDDYRASYIEKATGINHLDAVEAADLKAGQEHEQKTGWDFFVGMYTKKELKKFTSTPDSFWKIQVVTQSGEIVHPVSVDAVNITPFEKIMYPYLNRWSKAYRVKFPKVDFGDEFDLVLSSVVGESTLKWRDRR